MLGRAKKRLTNADLSLSIKVQTTTDELTKLHLLTLKDDYVENILIILENFNYFFNCTMGCLS